jgi:hypothetical protein
MFVWFSVIAMQGLQKFRTAAANERASERLLLLVSHFEQISGFSCTAAPI